MPTYSPITDVIDGAWRTNVGSDVLAPAVGEEPADDSTYIQSSQNPTADTVEIKFAPATDPQTNTGHIVRYRLRGDAGTKATVALVCGSTIIESWTHDPAPLSVTAYQQTLTNAGAIADYADLHLRITAAPHIDVPPPSSNAEAWVANPMPPSNGSVLNCSADYFRSDGYGGGRKHATMLHCPMNDRMYVFGGDCQGYASAADQAAGMSGDYRNDVWSYDPVTNNWRNEVTWDVADGKIHHWRPDWGMYAWDTRRQVFWFRVGGSNGGLMGHGCFAHMASSSGLRWDYGDGRIPPDMTFISGASLNLTDNATNYIEYNPATHTVGFNTSGYTGGAVLPLYRAVTASGAVTTVTNDRPWYINWGQYQDDNADPRHYVDPTHLIYFDPATNTWTDPGLARPEDSFPEANLMRQFDGRVHIQDWRAMCMIYDEAGDQLVYIGAGSGGTTCVIHYSFGANAWTRWDSTTPNTNLNMSRFSFNPADRLIYAIEGCGQSNPYKTTPLAWTYNVDTHVWGAPIPVPNSQLGPSLWTQVGYTTGQIVGGQYQNAESFLDDINEIVWWPEIENPLLCAYGFQDSAELQNLHAWHFKENRFELIAAPFDVNNRPHGTVCAFDTTHRLLLMYGQNAGDTDPLSVYYPTRNPVNYHKFVYTWSPSGFTKPTYGTMA